MMRSGSNLQRRPRPPAPAHEPPKWAVGDVVVCDLRLPVARQICEEKRENGGSSRC